MDAATLRLRLRREAGLRPAVALDHGCGEQRRRGEETVRKKSGYWWCATADPLAAAADEVLAATKVLLAASSSFSSSRPDFYALFGLPVSACGDPSSLCLHYRRLALLLRSSRSPPHADLAGDGGLVPGAVRGGAGGAEFLSLSDLRCLPAFGRLVTTFFQTTGRAPSDLGAVNLTSLNSSSAVLVSSSTPFSPSSANSDATVLGLVASLPYDVSVFAVDALLVPYGFDLAASETCLLMIK